MRFALTLPEGHVHCFPPQVFMLSSWRASTLCLAKGGFLFQGSARLLIPVSPPQDQGWFQLGATTIGTQRDSTSPPPKASNTTIVLTVHSASFHSIPCTQGIPTQSVPVRMWGL